MYEKTILNRKISLFKNDISSVESKLTEQIAGSSILVIGAAGSIGQAVTKQLLNYKPKKLSAVDLSENNLVELVRDVRSSLHIPDVNFNIYALDAGSDLFMNFLRHEKHYDYVLNLSALKHVRSEGDPHTLLRMLQTNVLNVAKFLSLIDEWENTKYFAVSTDKATNPVNLMGASKLAMEYVLFSGQHSAAISTARFANVAFSDGSLLHGFTQRILKRQPVSAPYDVKRYFLSHEEAGQLTMLSAILGERNEIYYPLLDEKNDALSFSDIASALLKSKGLQPILCDSEQEARQYVIDAETQSWPCYFFQSSTTGEKLIEEFVSPNDCLVSSNYENVGIIRVDSSEYEFDLEKFMYDIELLIETGVYTKGAIVEIFSRHMKNFNHEELGKNLSQRM